MIRGPVEQVIVGAASVAALSRGAGILPATSGFEQKVAKQVEWRRGWD